ncbi:lipocalin family protein [Myroides sp. DW712]|uniref:lipocalin family protein n=1 Tax=Myroides sp. DW712 TaxID=3389800 RepID=UPI003979AC1C
MKKLVLTFSLAALVLAGTVSCSSDDNSSEQQQKQTLVLASVNGTDVTVNEEVTFVVTVGTEVVEGVQIEVNGKAVKNPHVFDEGGTYKVVAKKNGYNQSNEITITVSEVGIAKQLNLEASRSTVTVGETVTFTITDGVEAVTGAELFIDDTKITSPYTFAEEGEFHVIAKKQGYATSNRVTITVEAVVDDRPIVGTWIPVHVKVDALGMTVADMAYPKKENCDDDTLAFNSDQTVKFDYHEENCDLKTTGADWSINGSVLTMTLFGQAMTVDVVENSATKLVIKAKGTQFEALIPILVPDLASSIPPTLLGLADVQLELKK